MKKISKVTKMDFSYRNQIARQAHFMSGGGLHETKKNKEKSRKGRFANTSKKKLKNIKNLRDLGDFFLLTKFFFSAIIQTGGLMNPLQSKEIKEIVVHLENTLKRTIYFGGVIGSHVLGINDEKSDIDMNFYCSNNEVEKFIGETFHRELDFTTTDGKEVHIVVKGLNSLKHLNKVSYPLVECLSNIVYFRNDTKGNLLERFFKTFLSDNINQLKFILNCFFIGRTSFECMSSDKRGSKVSFQDGNVNYKDLSKAYLYKSLIEQDIVIESFSKNDVPKEIRKTYKEIRNGYYEDSLLSEIRVFYKEFEINKIKEKIKNTNNGEYLETLAVIVCWED